jgi:cold shock CspA family protein
MNNQKYRGTLVAWNPAKSCGIICVREGTILHKFFLHLSAVDKIEPAEIKVGYPVVFEIDENRKPQIGHFWRAKNVEILSDKKLSVAEVLANASKSEVTL